MRRKELWAVLLGSGLALGLSAEAACAPPGRVVRVQSKTQSLAAALLDVARQGGIELILAAPGVKAMTAPKVRGRYGIEEALSILLSGSGLTIRRSADGAYIVTTLARAPAEEGGEALPEIMVVGKRTQNSDIRRRESDIQPYKVWTSEDVAQSHSSDINDFLRSRVTSNAQAGSAAQLAAGDSVSEVNLRGLGSGQTLVLVDGRRMPGMPAVNVAIYQPDLNGIAVSAIDRIEVLNSTAGGIYGPGATAGVINIVLKRDYHGADIGLTQGLSARGDAASRRIDARFGVSSGSGRTQLMVAASRTWGADLRAGDRAFTSRARALHRQRDPADFAATAPVSASVNVASATGQMLRLDPAYGGESLGAAMTSVPATYAGVGADGGALYRANAGRIDASLSPDAGGTERSLLTRPRLASLLANVRHRFGNTLEIYADLIVVENAGRAIVASGPRSITIAADAPGNPFQQDILVSFPLPGYETVTRYRNRAARLTGGLVLDLPRAWKANLDYSAARATTKTTMTGIGLDGSLDASANPLAGQAAFLASVVPFNRNEGFRAVRKNHFGDLTLRLAGPVAKLGGGPLSLSLLGEDRRERVPGSNVLFAVIEEEQPIPAFETRTRSVSAELRAPLTDRVAGPAGLRGLELQLAVRYDANRSTLPGNLNHPDGAAQRSKTDATAYTAGLRFFPIEGVMVRASSASGYLPPTANQIGSLTNSYTSSPTLLAQSALPNVYLISATSGQGPADPLRGGNRLGSEAVVTQISGGSTHLQSERARSISIGVVLTPVALERLRLSVDYTRIDKRNEIIDFYYGDQAYLLEHESRFAGRVIRAPLTDADRAKGYTAGVVTVVDMTSLNVGKTVIEAIDAQLDYRIPTDEMGDFRLHAAATWQPRLTRRTSSQGAAVNAVGTIGGPLSWRANGGIDWQRGPLDLGIVATYYHGYRAGWGSEGAAAAAKAAVLQGGTRIPAQIYFDIYATRRVALPSSPAGLHSLDIRFGIENLFDHRPPALVGSYASNYSLYGDPRLRRFELSLLGHF